jgi:ankyrin repeat protein
MSASSPTTVQSPTAVLDLHTKSLTVQALSDVLELRPQRLEELKRVDTYCGLTPLLAAVYHNNVDVAHWLIDNGSTINAVDTVWLPLVWAWKSDE